MSAEFPLAVPEVTRFQYPENGIALASCFLRVERRELFLKIVPCLFA